MRRRRNPLKSCHGRVTQIKWKKKWCLYQLRKISSSHGPIHSLKTSPNHKLNSNKSINTVRNKCLVILNFKAKNFEKR